MRAKVRERERLSILDRSKRKKINKDIQDSNSDLDQANLIDI